MQLETSITNQSYHARHNTRGNSHSRTRVFSICSLDVSSPCGQLVALMTYSNPDNKTETNPGQESLPYHCRKSQRDIYGIVQGCPLSSGSDSGVAIKRRPA
ncbi:hypothetical protein PIB30_015099 [Stylosanthes scabra]|uniref:Uncharacterized protein n=1 Tax=Stylosanthes scabra TaxID=79078 RepID=A0ABU6R768_9FABA|nr:hypothetical protein [Stylosanthes scabra]